MRTINLEYRLKEKLPKVKIVNGVPVLKAPVFDPQRTSEESIPSLGDDAYPLRETHYQQRMREGFQPRLVAFVEPGIAGWYNPVTCEAVGESREALWHEETHHDEYSRGNPRTPAHEHEVRERMRHCLNFYGKGGGDYHQ